MAPRQIRGIKRAEVSITNKTLQLDNPFVVFQIGNIVDISAETKHLPPEPDPITTAIVRIGGALIQFIKEYFIVGIAFLFINGLIPLLFGASVGGFISTALSTIASLVIFYKLLKRVIEIVKAARISLKKKDAPKVLYGVSIATSNGKFFRIYDYRQSRRDEILFNLAEVMKNQDQPVSCVFQIEGDFTGDFIQQSGVFGTGVNK
ncbi:hypothetical protein [Leptolyngbya sp. AN10]|uniref:hypothetical protein n=1 Tax=Leptolyngbya sp. AN10 TaxID=3423365 RepID=UPI003D310C2E